MINDPTEHPDYRTGLQYHEGALRLASESRWIEALDSARQSNFLLLGCGIPQTSPIIGINYYLAAKSMFERHEWHEASILAELSLQGLNTWEETPGKGEALLLLAKAHMRNRKPEEAKTAVLVLLSECHPSPRYEPIGSEAEGLLRELR